MNHILFVCMGNICRSPMAVGIFRSMAREAGVGTRINIDSAGTHAYHVGKSPDPRAVKVASELRIDLSGLIARQVAEADFVEFDCIVAMDRSNLEALKAFSPGGSSTEPRLLLDYAPEIGDLEVPDPYYGTLEDYRRAISLIYVGAKGLLMEVQNSVIC